MEFGRQSSLAEQIITSLYRGILSREPDEEGKSRYTRSLLQGTSLDEIIREFIDSAEFDCSRVVSLGHLELLSANSIQFDLSGEQLETLWQDIAKAWSRIGTHEPFYSVINSDGFRLQGMSSGAIEQFYSSGEADIRRAEQYLARHDRQLPHEGLCVDYGCGVGRTTLWLARRFRRVLAIDVSETHLGIARQALAQRGVNNVDFHLLRDRGDLSTLKEIDFFYSVIVLQHNPPPLIVEILRHVFDALKPGAAAFFQVPTYGKDYGWNFERHAAESALASGMEMHVVPQSTIFALAAKASCLPLEVQPDRCTGLPNWISNTFLFAKLGISTPA